MKTKLVKHFEDKVLKEKLAKVQPGDEVGARRALKIAHSLGPMWAEIADRGLIKRPQEEDLS